MAFSSNSSGGGPMADINVTPLVDVMLVLLIIFMVTAPLLTAGVPVNLPESRAKATEWAMAADPRVTAQALYEDLTTDMRPELKAITAPVTLVYAWNDQYPRKDPADAFFRGQYAAVADARYVGIGDSAHFVMLDQPEAFRAALDAFLAG